MCDTALKQFSACRRVKKVLDFLVTYDIRMIPLHPQILEISSLRNGKSSPSYLKRPLVSSPYLGYWGSYSFTTWPTVKPRLSAVSVEDRTAPKCAPRHAWKAREAGLQNTLTGLIFIMHGI